MNKKIGFIKSILLSNFKRLDSPYKITLALTYRCNLRCKICNIWKVPLKQEIGIQEIEKLFRSLKHLYWLDLTGGELTLKEDLLDIVKVIIKNAKKILILHISTNGQLPFKLMNLIKEVLRAGIIPVVNISIEAASALNDELRGVKGAYLNSLETFKILKGLRKGYYYLSCTISDHNIKHIPELIAELRKDIPFFSFSDLHFNIFYNSSHYFHNKDTVGLSSADIETVMSYLQLCKNGGFIKHFLETSYRRMYIQSLKQSEVSFKCQALRSMCFINPYGEVYPCTAYDKVMGNLQEYNYDLQKIWNQPHILKHCSEIKHNACRRCWGACEAYPSILGNMGKFITSG